uniref:TAR DNA-binding protein 43 N-terminal domain-containing protein n=1 Tax=Panagrolaimus sp. JU765 TaxID=591449 RepID=A0AC34RDA5_9BILA
MGTIKQEVEATDDIEVLWVAKKEIQAIPVYDGHEACEIPLTNNQIELKYLQQAFPEAEGLKFTVKDRIPKILKLVDGCFERPSTGWESGNLTVVRRNIPNMNNIVNPRSEGGSLPIMATAQDFLGQSEHWIRTNRSEETFQFPSYSPVYGNVLPGAFTSSISPQPPMVAHSHVFTSAIPLKAVPETANSPNVSRGSSRASSHCPEVRNSDPEPVPLEKKLVEEKDLVSSRENDEDFKKSNSRGKRQRNDSMINRSIPTKRSRSDTKDNGNQHESIHRGKHFDEIEKQDCRPRSNNPTKEDLIKHFGESYEKILKLPAFEKPENVYKIDIYFEEFKNRFFTNLRRSILQFGIFKPGFLWKLCKIVQSNQHVERLVDGSHKTCKICNRTLTMKHLFHLEHIVKYQEKWEVDPPHIIEIFKHIESENVKY